MTRFQIMPDSTIQDRQQSELLQMLQSIPLTQWLEGPQSYVF